VVSFFSNKAAHFRAGILLSIPEILQNIGIQSRLHSTTKLQ
jgi:hypothetical protein